MHRIPEVGDIVTIGNKDTEWLVTDAGKITNMHNNRCEWFTATPLPATFEAGTTFASKASTTFYVRNDGSEAIPVTPLEDIILRGRAKFKTVVEHTITRYKEF